MTGHIVGRLFETVATLLILCLLVFVGVHITGDPVRVLIGDNPNIGPEIYEAARARLGLDEPLPVQFAIFVGSILTSLDFGMSISQSRPVRDVILERIPYTLALGGVGMIVAVIMGVPAGILAALHRGGRFDAVVRVIAVTGLAIPSFWFASMLILLFAAILGWLPAFGAGSPAHVILPAFAAAVPVAGGLMRVTRTSMLEVLGGDYIEFARAKGLRERLVVWRHGLRNAAIPVLTFGGLALAGLLNGSVVVEVVFAWPGIGQLMVQAVQARDIPLVIATTMVSATLFIATAAVVDILYAYVDPRIRHRS